MRGNYMEKPLVTIQLTCYNHEKYVRNAIDSIMHGTYQNFELFISDDGSKDDSRKIINKAYEEYGKDSRIHLFLAEENTAFGIVDEMAEKYRGKYICFMGADDVFKSEKIEKQVDFFENNEEYKVCFTYVDIGYTQNEKNVAKFKSIFNRPLLKNKYELCNQLLVGSNFLCAPSCMMYREVYEEFGRFNYDYLQLQDYEMWVKVAQKYYFYVLEEPLTIYGVVENSLSTSGDIGGEIRTLTEETEIFYEQVANMPDEIFKLVFPDDNSYGESCEDIMCRRFLVFYNSRKANYRQLCIEYYYRNRQNKKFVSLLKNKYGINRKALYEISGKGMFERAYFSEIFKKLWNKKRFDVRRVDKSNEEIVNEICDILDSNVEEKKELFIDDICALYETCKKIDGGERYFSELINECVLQGVKFK